MTPKYRESDKRAGGPNAVEWLLSNLMSYTDHSMQHRLKSNAPINTFMSTTIQPLISIK